MKYKFKHVVEYAALRAISGLVTILPYRLALGFGWVLAKVAHALARGRVATARARIREVFGDSLGDREVRRVAWISLRNLFFNGVESMRLGSITREKVQAVTDCASLDRVFKQANTGRGAIVAVAHMGNWEFAGVGAHMLGLPIFIIVARQSNPLTDAYLNLKRTMTGTEIIHRDSGALRKTIRHLRAGKVLALMTDLRSRTPGVPAKFLGGQANLVAGLGLFARQANVPVFPAIVSRVGWTHHRWQILDPIEPDLNLSKEADSLRMTQQVMDIFDKAVRAAPDQYFWYNKRWVLDPLE